MKRKRILTFYFLLLLTTPLLAQQYTPERPQRTMEQQVKELLNHAYKEIHDAQYRQEEALFDNYFNQQPEPLTRKLNTAGEVVGDTAFYNTTVRKTGSNPDWHFDALEFTVNYFGSEDSTIIRRKNHRYDLANALWWRSNEWETTGFRGQCTPVCGVYTTRNFSNAGVMTGGFRQVT